MTPAETDNEISLADSEQQNCAAVSTLSASEDLPVTHAGCR